MESERTDEYLEAIYKKQLEKAPVATSILAEALNVSAPAITDMLKGLKEQGLVEYQPNKGTRLSDTGMQRALRVVRRHRLWERFLTDILGMKWDRVHDEACKLEHVNSPDIERELQRLLGGADTCPHGHSIPDSNGKVRDEKMFPLSRLKPQQKVAIVAISKESPELLRKIKQMGLSPQTDLTIIGKDKDGSVEVETNGTRIHLDSELASVIMTQEAVPREVMENKGDLPLSSLATGQSGIIKAYSGGRGMLGRCLSLGFTPGSAVKMLENYRRGPVLVKIHDTSVALGRSLAEKIMVNIAEDIC